MTTQCVDHQIQNSFWAKVSLRWPVTRPNQLVRQLQARATLRHLPAHIQRDIGLYNADHAASSRSNWW